MIEVTLIYGFINSVILALIALDSASLSGSAEFPTSRTERCMFWLVTPCGFSSTSFSSLFSAAILAVLLTAAIGAALYRFVLLRVRGLVISEVIATFGVGLAIWRRFDIWIHDLRIHASRVHDGSIVLEHVRRSSETLDCRCGDNACCRALFVHASH